MDLDTDAASCGACGAACDVGLSCAGGACVPGETLVQIDSMISTQFVRTADGRVLVWGNNQFGKGNPKSDAELITYPEQLDLPEPVVEVRTSWITTCARGVSGRVWCWGASGGIPGAAPEEASHNFVAVAGVLDARTLMVSGEGHCVLDVHGRGLCWSTNTSEELTTGSGREVERPLLAAVEMSAVAGDLVTLLPSIAAFEHGGVLAWGAPDAVGSPPPDLPQNVRLPLVVPGLADPVRVEGGALSFCASLRAGRVYCWGREILPFEPAYEPFLAFEHGPYKKIAVSTGLCALSFAGEVECFNHREDYLVPSWLGEVERDGVADISSSVSSVCLLMQDQRVLCKGSNSEGEQGNGTVGGAIDAMTEVHLPALH